MLDNIMSYFVLIYKILDKQLFVLYPSIHCVSRSTQAEREREVNHRSSNISIGLEKGPSTNPE